MQGHAPLDPRRIDQAFLHLNEKLVLGMAPFFSLHKSCICLFCGRGCNRCKLHSVFSAGHVDKHYKWNNYISLSHAGSRYTGCKDLCVFREDMQCNPGKFALQFSMRAGYTQNATSSKFSMGTTAAYAAILPHSTMRTTATKLARSTCLPVRTSIALSASMF